MNEVPLYRDTSCQRWGGGGWERGVGGGPSADLPGLGFALTVGGGAGSGFRVQGSENSRFRVQNPGFRVQGHAFDMSVGLRIDFVMSVGTLRIGFDLSVGTPPLSLTWRAPAQIVHLPFQLNFNCTLAISAVFHTCKLYTCAGARQVKGKGVRIKEDTPGALACPTGARQV